jgi:hypothetical protein
LAADACALDDSSLLNLGVANNALATRAVVIEVIQEPISRDPVSFVACALEAVENPLLFRARIVGFLLSAGCAGLGDMDNRTEGH